MAIGYRARDNGFSGKLLSMAQEWDNEIVEDFSSRMDYGGYLCLDRLLSAQLPLSKPEHPDELLFIIQHQTSELWMKLVIHELQIAIESLRQDQLAPCFKILARVKQVQRMMFEQWAVLETLTPSEYAQFRGVLGNASGFQSFQHRMIEFLLGNKDARMIRVFENRPEAKDALQAALEKPSLYDEFWLFLDRQGILKVPESATHRDWSQSYQSNDDLMPVLTQIYNHPHEHWGAYEMCEKLVDVEESYLLWRFRHLKTVERIIGFKKGTGGSAGASYLRKGLDFSLFPELWSVRTLIGS